LKASQKLKHNELYDNSSEEEDLQAEQSGGTVFLKPVTAEDTHSQASANVAEDEREVGSLAKLLGSQVRNSARGDLSDPSDADISTPSAKGTGSRAQDTRVQGKQAQGSREA